MERWLDPSKSSAKMVAGGFFIKPAKKTIAILLLFSSLALAKPLGARQAFAEAQLVYSKGDFAKAEQLLTRNLENYPSHEASLLYLGKSLFRLGRMDEAWAAFKRVEETYLDSESKYEFGYSAYRAKNWEKAARVLTTVPDTNQNYDLAMYYASVSLLNLERFKDAETSMKKAVVLPSRFLASRKAILKFLKDENSAQSQPELKEPTQSVDPQSPKIGTNQQKKQGQSTKSLADNSPGTVPAQGGMKKRYPVTFDTGAEVLYVEEPEFEDRRKQTTQWQQGPQRSLGLFLGGERTLQDMGGRRKDIKSSSKAGAYLKGESQSQNPGFGLAFGYNLEGSSLNTSGEYKPVGLERYKDLDMWERAIPHFTEFAPKQELFGKLNLGLQYTASRYKGILYGGAKGLQIGDESHRSVFGGMLIEFDGERIIGSLGAETNDWRGLGYESLRSSSAFAKALFPLSGNLNLGVSGARHLIQEPLQILEFPLGINQFEFSAEQAFALSFKLKANAGVMGIENYLRGNLQSGTTTADGMRTYGGIEVTWNPLKWLIISAKQQNSILRWSQIEPVTNADFWAGKAPDYEEYSLFEFKVYRPF